MSLTLHTFPSGVDPIRTSPVPNTALATNFFPGEKIGESRFQRPAFNCVRIVGEELKTCTQLFIRSTKYRVAVINEELIGNELVADQLLVWFLVYPKEGSSPVDGEVGIASVENLVVTVETTSGTETGDGSVEVTP